MDEQPLLHPRGGRQGSGSSCNSSSHAQAFYNNPRSCVVSQDVPGPPTRKVRFPLLTVCKPFVVGEQTRSEHSPELRGAASSRASPAAERALIAPILPDGAAQAAAPMASHAAGVMGQRERA